MTQDVVADDIEFENPPEIQILFEDEHLVAIHKPAGLLVHRTYLARREKYFAMQMTRDLVGCHVFPVHRLDRPTSGVLLFAKSSEVANLLCQQFQDKTTEKTYLALVRGNVNESLVMDYPLKEELDDIADKHADKDKKAQEAVSHFWPLLNAEIPYQSGRYPTSRYALMKLRPITGRKHQLRRHLAHFRHPILGDTTHGDGKQNKFIRDFLSTRRLWLIAKKLEFTHPVTHERLSIEAELEPEWLEAFEKFGWNNSNLQCGKDLEIA
ncbi:tRNA pseudouridine(65) synthase TruC [Shewanella sp. OPT22]|nr:tRNA pseudouridine(65) synthase TruC [Shewanella sp. OPT22]